MTKITVSLWRDDVFCGYDVSIACEAATVGDYVGALKEFFDQNMAPCLGCDGCCHERAPLMLCDFALSGAADFGLWLNEVAHIACRDGVVDIMLRRDGEDNCLFLDTVNKSCRRHAERPFVCRTHVCLAKSRRAELLRQELVNAGTDALILYWCERDPDVPRKYGFKVADYEPNAFYRAGSAWREVLLHDILSPALWQDLRKA